ncbi:hypothetical protein LFL96_25865 [Paraburkholderia sp. D15]|uniref:hypothetical protein n=1 Tax=Paraburkholderia sp. D15 TaxID=2880218 RepID=UPI0024785CAF|nr:hypothetical protein [Paraburkholderia sp. D15]WGS54443.1 hypothetical protein LFL96_25865 [Paraburkholderia sp. D15]
MSTYFNIVNLDKKEQASLVILKSQDEVDATVAQWEKKNRKKWLSKTRQEDFSNWGKQYDPEGYEKQEDGSWTREIHKFYQFHQKLVFGFIFWEACGNQWGRVSEWFGDRVIIICDTSGANEPNSPYRDYEHWIAMDDYKPVQFHTTYNEWKDAQR